MRGDFTRDTRERARRMATRAVLLQQGRPLLDADINEQAGLVADRSEAIVRHVVGLHGAPRDEAGFGISAAGAGFMIGAGAIYAEGLPLANPATLSYHEQFPPGILPQLSAAVPDGQEALVYVEAVLRPALDPMLADPALDGVETAVRQVAGWAVRVAPLAGIGLPRENLIEALDRNAAVDLVPWRGTSGGLDADVDIAGTDPGPCEIAPSAGYLDQLNRLYRVEIQDGGGPGTATFKWTEDASREAGLRAAGAGFAIDLPQGRAAEWFPTGAIVEVIDDARARAGLTGPIGAITSATGAALTIGGIAAAALTAGIRIRRWASMPAPLPAAGAWTVLSMGVRVRFSSGNYVTGAAWTIPARTVLGDIAWPPYAFADRTETIGGTAVGFYAPFEGRRYHAPLALVQRSGATFQVTRDLRDLFPPLTDLTADKVRFDDDVSHLGAADVQGAIDALVRRGGECCTWHAETSTDLQALVDAIRPRGSGTLCLSTGNFELERPLRITGKGHIRIIGAGPGTKLWCRVGPQALVIEDCFSAEVLDMVVAAEAPEVPARLGRTAGALDIAGSGPVRVLRATLITQGRRWKQSAALRVACSTKPGGGDVTVEDCDIVAGDLASGIIVLDAHRLCIAGNRIRPRNEPIAKTLTRWSQDKQMAAAVGRLAISHALAQPPQAPQRTRPATRIDQRLFAERAITVRDQPISFFASTLLQPADLAVMARLLLDELPNGNSRTFRLRLRRLVSVILVHAGRPPLAKQQFFVFDQFYDVVSKLVAPSIDSAIVVGGGHARDVVIADNRIEGALRGIRVGVGAGVAKQRLPLGTLHIERNVIRLRVAPTDIVRHAIYVGNSERSWIVDNDIAPETADPDFADPRANDLRKTNFDRLHGEGVRVVGELGPLLHIRGNVVRGCPFAFTVTATGGSDQQKLWLVHGNYSDGGVTSYRLDNRCKKVDCL